MATSGGERDTPVETGLESSGSGVPDESEGWLVTLSDYITIRDQTLST